MTFKEGVDAMAFAGEVVVTACMLQAVTRAAMTAVAAIVAILRIVLSLESGVPSDPLW